MSDELRARDLLASHVAPPPPAGLEARILDRTVRRSRARLGFAVPAAVAIAALVAGALLVAPALGLLRGPSGAPHAAPAAPPVAWRGAGVAYDAGAHYILAFGGDDGHGAALDSTWAWTPAGWHELTPATRPPARRDARLAYDRGRGQLLLFGGTDGAGRPLDDTWAWTGLTWRRAGTAVSPPWAGT